MPALKVTFFGDAKQLEATYVKQGALAKTMASSITSSMAKTAAALSAQIALQKEQGKSYVETAAALAVLNKQMLEFGLISKQQVGIDAAAEARRMALFRASGGVTGSEVTGAGMGVDWYARRKEREAILQAGSRSLTGSEVTITTADTAKLAQLREQLSGSWLSARRARKEISAMAKVRGIGQLAADVSNVGMAGHGVSRIFGEIVTIFREWAQGRGSGRILGSFTYLLNLVSNRLKMSFLTFGIYVAAIAETALIIYERFFNLKNLLKDAAFDLSKIEIPDTYVAKLDRHMSNLKNQQRELNEELQKTIDHYNSAAEAAKRNADVSKEHFEHLRRMNELSSLTDRQKENRLVEIDRQERASDIQAKLHERAALNDESRQKFQQANSGKFVGLRTKEEDAELKQGLDAQKEAAQKFLTGDKSGIWEGFQRATASILNTVSYGLLDKDVVRRLETAGNEGNKLANTLIKKANDFQDTIKQNDILRKEQQLIIDEANKSASGASEIGLSIPNMLKTASQKNADEAAENRAKHNRIDKLDLPLSDNQRIGAFAMQASSPLVNIAQQHLSESKKTNTILTRIEAAWKVNPGVGINQIITEIISGPFK